ncbi:MAG: methionine--tRNA ligase [Synergistales bacterium]|nr:methionine--tRNA ligase [Bacteroidales bacterium]MDY6435706.1 methionine--tRNA ligase [Synergistales bacterium]MDY6393298.1 methionine--tRNA ligase [Bacteroidales bacterium]MDY6395587.1 methionine--tRNA ligase [Bacteroidales bacterium]MDY6403347.1 methionine--tRNA ligase [Bacteroidales bacterium]
MTYTDKEKKFKRFTVTTALPYANGPIHIGHMAGVYIPADIYCRYLRMMGEEVLFIGGSDEHGVPVTIRAKKEGCTPQDVVDRYHNIIKKSFEEFGTSFDIYSRTTSNIHQKTASDFFLKLYNEGKFIEQTSKQYYDEQEQTFLADRYITGTCPICGNEHAYGDQCESCGSSLNATDLINPKSALSGNVPVLKETKHWFLPLNDYESFLKEWILENHKEWKTNVYGQCKSWLDNGLQPRAVTRDLDWGIKVPLKDAEGKVLYVWFDAPIGYISNTIEYDKDNWEKWWKQKDTKLVHFIGKDNIVFHCIVFPSMLKAAGDYILPENVPANEFLNLEGDKISTSRNWAVWLNEYLEDFPNKQDVLKYVLCANAPETKDNDFTWKDFQTRNNSELVAILGNFVNRTIVLTHKYFNGKVPAKNELNELDKQTIEEIKLYPEKIGTLIENYKFRDALFEMMNLARLGNKYLTENEPWKTFKTDIKRTETVLNISLQICANLAILMEPFVQFSAKKLQQMLNLNSLKWFEAGNCELLKVGQEIQPAELLFERIEDADIQKQLNKLEASKKANAINNAEVTPQKPNVSFEDFSAMDIRVGTILEAEKVTKTKKLLKLTIDTGIDKRTIVSGIAEYFSPEEIIGKQVSVLVNLAPKNLKGIESQGMILMAENADGELCFVEPQKQFKNGSTIK